MELKTWQRLEEVGYKPKTEKVMRKRGEHAGKEVDVDIEVLRYDFESGKVIVTDTKNAEYIKNNEAKTQKRKDESVAKKATYRQSGATAFRRNAIDKKGFDLKSTEKGKDIITAYTVIKTASFERQLKTKYNLGFSDGKPKKSVETQLKNAEARKKAEEDKITALKAKMKQE